MGGSAFLNLGSTTVSFQYGKTLLFSGSFNSLVAPPPASVLADGTESTVTGAGLNGIDNPLCGPGSSTLQVWPLVAITRAAVGLPAVIVPPLTLN